MDIKQKWKEFIARLESPQDDIDDSVPNLSGAESFDIDEAPERVTDEEERVDESETPPEEEQEMSAEACEAAIEAEGACRSEYDEESKEAEQAAEDMPDSEQDFTDSEPSEEEASEAGNEAQKPEGSKWANYPFFAKIGFKKPKYDDKPAITSDEGINEEEAKSEDTSQIAISEEREEAVPAPIKSDGERKEERTRKARSAPKADEAKNRSALLKEDKSRKKFVPSRAAHHDLSGYDERTLKELKAQLEREAKREKRLDKLSLAWTLLSTLFAIVSTCIFVGKKWVDSVYSYILVALLALYIGVFVGLLIFAFQNPSKNSKRAKSYKNLLSVFKAFVNVSFLVITAVNMAALAASTNLGLSKWLFFAVTFLVAVIQLGIKIAVFVVHSVRKNISRRYKVRVKTFANGERMKHTKRDKRKERKYR